MSIPNSAAKDHEVSHDVPSAGVTNHSWAECCRTHLNVDGVASHPRHPSP